MTKPELLREIGVHLKKIVDIYNQLAKSPDTFTPGEIDMMINNASKIIEYSAIVKHQPASAQNTDDQVKLRDLEDKLRVLSEQVKNREQEITRLKEENKDLEVKVQQQKHLADAFNIDIPEINTQVDSNSTLAKTDLLNDTLATNIQPVEEVKKEEPVLKMETPVYHEPVKETLVEPIEKTFPPQSLVTKYESESDAGKKTIISNLHETVIDGSKENLAEKMMNAKVLDLSKVIPLHEKFMYTNELFGKNSDHYTQFVEAMNTKQTWKEAEQLLAQAASMYKWDPENKTALTFIALIQRRFN